MKFTEFDKCIYHQLKHYFKFNTNEGALHNIQDRRNIFHRAHLIQAFNEGIRLKDYIRMQQKFMSVRVRCVATDSIYANNANRKFCTKYGISTSFIRKGRATKDEQLRKVLRSELSKESATQLEGSFGSQKRHYLLSRIKARNRKNGNPVYFLRNTHDKMPC